jgi:hypothetical protein
MEWIVTGLQAAAPGWSIAPAIAWQRRGQTDGTREEAI